MTINQPFLDYWHRHVALNWANFIFGIHDATPGPVEKRDIAGSRPIDDGKGLGDLKGGRPEK